MNVIPRSLVVGVFLSVCAGANVCAEDAATPAGTNAVGISTNIVPSIVLRNLSNEYVFVSNLCYPGPEDSKKPRSVVVLDFMASDCEPCKKEMPAFLKVTREFKEKGVKAFLVSIDPLSKLEDLKKVVQSLGVDCEVLLDPYKVAATKCGVTRIPRTFVLSRERRVVGDLGAGVDFEKRLRAALERAIQ